MKSICLETRRWLLISQQKALTSEETQKHLWCRCKFPIPESILTWDLLTTTYPNNRAVCGNLCNSRWNHRKSSQASGCVPRALWVTKHLQNRIQSPTNMSEAQRLRQNSTWWTASLNDPNPGAAATMYNVSTVSVWDLAVCSLLNCFKYWKSLIIIIIITSFILPGGRMKITISFALTHFDLYKISMNRQVLSCENLARTKL